jgi:hypothetical protein
MNGTIGQMLTLTADIAETLLAIKDTDSSITPELIDKIEQLHTLAQLPVETVADVEEPELPAELSPKEEIQCEPVAETTRQAPPKLEDTLELTEQEEDAVKETPEVPEPPETAEAPETAETPEEAGPASVTSLSSATLREAMSLNDLFLYRRTLFGGSAAAFNDALTQIATFSHISEVRNFMRDTLHINMKTSEAKDFINIMAPFFSEF